jgi:hypothetical protein
LQLAEDQGIQLGADTEQQLPGVSLFKGKLGVEGLEKGKVSGVEVGGWCLAGWSKGA